MRRILLLLFVALWPTALMYGQTGNSASKLLHRIHKLQNTTRVLYLAAHPDDENTRMISWLENDRHIRTAYLSLTRGDGGQNLIGTELGAKLGVLRSQELMQARAIDGGEQFFTRAVDFGYSKTADETFRQWNKEQVLSDVVWVIRNFKPDVIITRFPADSRAGHGHHTASAMLALEAFDMAADPEFYPEQLSYTSPWQVRRIFWNHSTWWRQNLDSIAANDDRYTVVDIGTYNGLLGMSCNELGSYSRSQHKSQGFGVSVQRGSTKEYLQLLKGDKVKNDLADGIEQGWGRYGWKKGDEQLRALVNDFNPVKPWESVQLMQELLEGSAAIDDEDQKLWFREELTELMALCLGVKAELVSSHEYYALGTEDAAFQLSLINRSPIPVKVKEISIHEHHLEVDSILLENELHDWDITLRLEEEVSQAYWLVNSYDKMFQVEDQRMIGLPENKPVINTNLLLEVHGSEFLIKPEVIFKFTDRVDGEVIRPMVVAPSIVVNPSESNLVFVDDAPKQLDFELRSFSEEDLRIEVKAEGWNVEPNSFEFKGGAAQSWKSMSLVVSPTESSLKAPELEFMLDEKAVMSLSEIDYPHIQKRVVFEPARVKLVQLDLKKRGTRIGYIEGAGDMVPSALRLMGYEVDMLTKEMIQSDDLSGYQAIICGIRAYNTQEWLFELEEALFDYVENGGNFIVQYNTASRGLRNKDFGIYPFTLSRQRVTEEDAEVSFLIPSHPVLNEPNKLGPEDFDQWVQERGLYFASDWDDAYEAPIGWHDLDEPERAGGLIIARKGKGSYMYTGISFFRELPAGVPGAYRLLANLISYEP